MIIGKTLQRMGGDGTPDYQDIAGDVFLSICQTLARGKFRGNCKAGTLVYLIVERRVRDHIRMKRAKRRTPVLMPDPAPQPTPEQIYEQEDQRRTVVRLLPAMQGWRQRQVAAWTLLGVDRAVIANSLQIPQNDVGHYLDTATRALKNLYRRLQ